MDLQLEMRDVQGAFGWSNYRTYYYNAHGGDCCSIEPKIIRPADDIWPWPLEMQAAPAAPDPYRDLNGEVYRYALCHSVQVKNPAGDWITVYKDPCFDSRRPY